MNGEETTHSSRLGRFVRRHWVLLLVLALLGGGLPWLFYEPTYELRVSYETTRLTGPLRPDGTVDYLAAIDAQCRDGVTSENNAAPLLIAALGLYPYLPQTARMQILDTLGLRSEDVTGANFEDYEQYLRKVAPSKAPPFGAEDLSAATGRPWRAGEFPTLAAYLAAYDKTLDKVAAATLRRRLYIPITAGVPNGTIAEMYLPCLHLSKPSAKALVARAMLRAGEGDVDGACSDLLACHRFARLVGQGPTLIERLVACSMESVACGADEALIGAGRLRAPQARKLLGDLQGLSKLPSLPESVVNLERYGPLQAIQVMAVEGVERGMQRVGLMWARGAGGALSPPRPERNIDWNRAMIAVNSVYDGYVRAVTQPTFSRRQKELAAVSDQVGQVCASVELHAKPSLPWPSWWERIFSNDSQAGFFRRAAKKDPETAAVAVLATIPTGAILQYDRTVMKWQLVHVGLALAAYRSEKGAYPKDLSALVPEYLKAVPDDLFTEKPLIYRQTPAGWIVYSVGVNGKDDGGVDPTTDKPAEDDIVLRLYPRPADVQPGTATPLPAAAPASQGSQP